MEALTLSKQLTNHFEEHAFAIVVDQERSNNDDYPKTRGNKKVPDKINVYRTHRASEDNPISSLGIVNRLGI